MKLVYITIGVNSAFSSQVARLLNNFKNKKVFEEITLLIGNCSDDSKNSLDNLDPDIKVYEFNTYSQYPFLFQYSRTHLKPIIDLIDFDDDTIVQTRGELGAYLAYKLIKKKNPKFDNMIIDVRGLIKEEVADFLKLNPVLKFVKNYLFVQAASIFKKAKYITAVSLELKHYVINNYKISNNKVFVNHSLAGSNFVFDKVKRAKIRKQLNLTDNDVLFVFSTGGENDWQNTNEIIKSITEKGYKVLILSKKTYNMEGVISLYSDYNDMYGYLSAADISIIIRDKHIINKVASPIKFSEYLCCGLPVIANEGVQMIKELTTVYNVGKIVNQLSEINEEMINTLLKYDREKISEIGLKLLGEDSVTSKFEEIYKSFKQ